MDPLKRSLARLALLQKAAADPTKGTLARAEFGKLAQAQARVVQMQQQASNSTSPAASPAPRKQQASVALPPELSSKLLM